MVNLILRQAIKEKGLTIEQLAELSGVDKRTIYFYLSGRAKCTQADTLYRLGKILDRSVEDLIK